MCDDELPNCAALPGLFTAERDVCRWPMAELCLRTCGECQRVAAAAACMSRIDDCANPFCDERVDWSAFFERVVSNQSAHGARLLGSEPWVAEFPNFLTAAEADEMVRIGLSEGLRDEDEHPNRIRNVSVTNCDSARCMQEPFVNELSRRLSELLQLPSNSFECVSIRQPAYSPSLLLTRCIYIYIHTCVCVYVYIHTHLFTRDLRVNLG